MDEKNTIKDIILNIGIILGIIFYVIIYLIIAQYTTVSRFMSFNVSVVNAVKKEPLTEEYTSWDTLEEKLRTVGYIYYMKDQSDDVIVRADINYKDYFLFNGEHKQIRIEWSKKGLKSVSKDTLEAVYNFEGLKPSSVAKFILAGDISTDRYKIYDIQAYSYFSYYILGKFFFPLESDKGRVWIGFLRSREESKQH